MVRLLDPGAHFGDISFIYKCPVTCSVLSRKYSSLSLLDHVALRQLTNEFPVYDSLLRKKVKKYRDPKINCMLKYLKNVEAFEKFTTDSLLEINYTLEF